MLEEKVKVAEEEAQLLARKSREAEEEIRRARESAVKVLTCCLDRYWTEQLTCLERRRKVSDGEESVSSRGESSYNCTYI